MGSYMKQKVIYPGTFDPVTNGHLDIIQRAAKIFTEVIVAVANNNIKRPHFNLESRINFIKHELSHCKNITVIGFNCLLIDFVHQQNANIILRGLRAINDFEYEFQLAGMNKQLSPDIETIFLTPSAHCMFISSSLVKEIALLNGDINKFVPINVAKAFMAC